MSQPSLRQAAATENRRRAASGEPPLPVVPSKRLRNHGANQSWRPALALCPSDSIDERCDLMRFLGAEGVKTIKAGGSLRSWPRAAASDDVYIHPDKMNFVRAVAEDPAEASLLRSPAGTVPEDAFIVGSGTQIRELNDVLWAHGRVLPVLGGYDGQTMAGVVQTATHGSVLKLGPICDAVLAINLVDAQGRKPSLARPESLVRLNREEEPQWPTGSRLKNGGLSDRSSTRPHHLTVCRSRETAPCFLLPSTCESSVRPKTGTPVSGSLSPISSSDLTLSPFRKSEMTSADLDISSVTWTR